LRELASSPVPPGAAGLARMLVACAEDAIRSRLGLSPDSTTAVVNTEGATDPESYKAILAG
jgi:diaminopropionate ammonia-lyase